MASRIVRTVRFVIRIYGSWIQLFNRWKSQVVTKWSLEKFVDPYGSYEPYELKMASRIARTVRFVKRIYASWIQLFSRWKSQVVTKWSWENSSIRTDRTDRTNWKWLHGSWNFVSRFSHLARANQHGVLNKQYVILVEDNFCIANCWRRIFSYEKRMWYCEAFYSCLLFMLQYEQSWHGIKFHRQ